MTGNALSRWDCHYTKTSEEENTINNKEEKPCLISRLCPSCARSSCLAWRRALRNGWPDPKQASLSHAEFVGLLVQDEKTHRDNLRLRRLLKKARLR